MTERTQLISAFETDGFVAIPSFLTDAELEDLRTNVARFINERIPTLSREQVFYEDIHDVHSLKQIQHMEEHDPWFGDLFLSSRFHRLAELLLKGAVIGKNLQYFNKPAGVGKPTPAHQDGFYFMLDPCEAITMWLALDDVDEENGCVRYVPGSHRLGMRSHARTKTLGFSQGITDYPTDKDRVLETPIIAKPGDLLVHDAMTIHRADGNHSKNRSRRALGFVYFSERAREDSAAQAAYQQRLAQELKSEGKI